MRFRARGAVATLGDLRETEDAIRSYYTLTVTYRVSTRTDLASLSIRKAFAVLIPPPSMGDGHGEVLGYAAEPNSCQRGRPHNSEPSPPQGRLDHVMERRIVKLRHTT